jgi:hypothetical protein
MSRLRTYVGRHHVALLALFVALGGTSYAAVKLPANSVGSKQIKKKAVTPAKVAPSTVKLFKGQKGDQGATGAMGPSGAKGNPGSDGAPGQPGTDGSPALSGFVGRINTLPSTGDVYGAPSGISTANASEAAVSAVAPHASFTARDLFVQLTNAPGSGSGRSFELMVNGTPTLNCSVSNTLGSCSDPFNNAAVPADATLSIRTGVGFGSSAPADLRFGFRATTP